MAFGIPGSQSSGNDTGPRLNGRIQYDARVGYWKTIKRYQDSAGTWATEEGDDFKNATLLMDFGSMEAGYMKLSGGAPQFVLVPMGQPWPEQPAETQLDDRGKPRKTHQPGIRLKVSAPEHFGDAEAYYFSVTSKTVLEPLEALYEEFKAAPEAAKGLIPLVACTGTVTIQAGQSKFKAPIFEIKSWHERPECFGERTVPAPGGKLETAKPAAASKHVAPPAAKGGGKTAQIDDSDIPFSPCWQ